MNRVSMDRVILRSNLPQDGLERIGIIGRLERRPESIACRTGCRFKHSTRCSISRMALKLTQQRWDLPEDVQPFLLDLLNYRAVQQ